MTVEVEVALLKQANDVISTRLDKLEDAVEAVRRNINRGLGALAVVLGGTLANVFIAASHLGKGK